MPIVLGKHDRHREAQAGLGPTELGDASMKEIKDCMQCLLLQRVTVLVCTWENECCQNVKAKKAHS